MPYFEWTAELIIDRGAIDEDHLLLVNLVNSLHDAATEGLSPSTVMERMAELVFYTQDHLLREEDVMAAVGFPNLDSHKQGHIELMAHLHALQRDYNSGQATTALQLASLLRDWLSNHIREADGELRQFLQDSAPPAALAGSLSG